jgi:hypothetical protein
VIATTESPGSSTRARPPGEDATALRTTVGARATTDSTRAVPRAGTDTASGVEE